MIFHLPIDGKLALLGSDFLVKLEAVGRKEGLELSDFEGKGIE